MYIQGCAEKSVKAGKYVLGKKELPNKCFLKTVEGNNFGVVKIFVLNSFFLMLHPLGVVNIAPRKK